jgi:predicted ribosome quality control (RQC) complex YloA/Tae2 family protein
LRLISLLATHGDMALNATEIQRLLDELSPILVRGRIQKIYQPGDRLLIFEFRVPGETHRLLISCEPETARIHLISRPLHNPSSPPSFCRFLRAHVQGARVENIRQVGHDRIVIFDVSTRHGPRTMVCQLGRHNANLLVLDERGHVLRDLNGRQNLVGRPYEAPAQRGPGSMEEQAAWSDAQSQSHRFPVSGAIEAHYEDKERMLTADRTRQERLRVLRKSLAKTRRRIEAWREDLAKAAAFRDYARYGELIKANLRAITTGMDGITLVDYYDASLPEVTLPLDPTKSALQNMNEYFKKHRKHLTAERELHPRIASAEQEVDALRREITAIEEGTWTAPPAHSDLPTTMADSRLRHSDAKRRGPFRRFMSADGLPIFVGRNAKENEELTFRFANSDDLWLHARDAPGSHVVIRLPKGADPPLETLREAATLALLYSDVKKSGKGDVIYTRRKWVKKAKGQSPGAVNVTQEKTISLKLDAERSAALKERSR